MSIFKKKFLSFLPILILIIISVEGSAAQAVELKIKFVAESPAAVQVEGSLTPGNYTSSNTNWSFLNSYADAENLGARIRDLELKNASNRRVEYKKLMDGEYLAASAAIKWNYRVNIDPLPNEKTTAHVSWATKERGILMLNDLLPQFVIKDNQPISACIEFDMPPEWKIISSEKKIGENVYEVASVEKSVFLIGKNWRENSVSIENDSIKIAFGGEWKFSETEAAEIIGEIWREYRRVFGEIPCGKAQIALVRFPDQIKFGRWEADTRGSTSVIFSGDMPFKTTSIQLLHEQLRHELFHLWIPNDLVLKGNYDWFYEGFTVYQALKTGVTLNRLRFEDFLDTLSEAYKIDNFQSKKISLIEAAKNSRNSINPQVYSRGMIAAFLCDLALLRTSRGKRSIADVFKRVHDQHGRQTASSGGKIEDGGAAILKILSERSELKNIIEKYISGIEPINWSAELESAGIKATATDSGLKLSVKTKLGGRQKDLLNELGYNNWRKISGN